MVRALLNYAPYVSPVIQLAPGIFQWNSQVPALPRNLATKVYGAGEDKTIIRLSAAAPRAFDFGKIADYDVFQGIELSDFTVDCNNIGGQHHVVIGTYINGGVVSRISVNLFSVRRVRTINVPSNTNAGIAHRLNIWIVPSIQSGDNPCTLNDHVYEDLDFLQGGNMGLVVGATGAGNVSNCTYARIYVNRFKHDTGISAPAGGASSSNLQIGSAAMGAGPVWIDNFYGARSYDVTIEVDNYTDLHIGSMVSYDPTNSGLLCANFNPPSVRQNARIDYHHHICNQTCTATTTSIACNTGGVAKPDLERISYGTLIVEKQGVTGAAPGAFNLLSISSMEVERYYHLVNSTVSDAGVLSDGGGIRLAPATGINMRFKIGSYIEVHAANYPSAHYVGALTIATNPGAGTSLDIDIGSMTFNNTTTLAARNSSDSLMSLGGGGRLTNLSLTGSIRRVRFIAFTQNLNQGFYFVITSATQIPQFIFDDCNFTGMSARPANGEIFVDNNGSVDSSMLMETNIKWQNGTRTAAQAVGGASPITYVNKTGIPGTLYLQGGVVTNLTVRGTAIISGGTGQNNVSAKLLPGDTAVITYSTAGNFYFMPDF